ncbi:MAG: hypothetical protein DME18_07550 [Verrucomicrobia bacterium]|nr:MAG: hypothetical protein DME18_07550 [Verrucomicrobiota bacterium]
MSRRFRNANKSPCRKGRWKCGEVVLKRRWPILLAVALGIAAAVVAVNRRSPPEPVYKGKTVTAWARDMNTSDPLVRSNAALALEAIGPYAVPVLVQSLDRRDSILKRLFLSLAPKLPVWFRRSFIRAFRPFDAVNDRLAAVNALGALGTNAPVRALTRALHDPERQIAVQAATALGNIGKLAVPELIRALNDKDGYVRSMACYAISKIGPDAPGAAPVLIQRLTDSFVGIPAQAVDALGRIGRPAVVALSGALKSPDEQVIGRHERASKRRRARFD